MIIIFLNVFLTKGRTEDDKIRKVLTVLKFHKLFFFFSSGKSAAKRGTVQTLKTGSKNLFFFLYNVRIWTQCARACFVPQVYPRFFLRWLILLVTVLDSKSA